MPRESKRPGDGIAIELNVGGEAWHRVSTLDDSGPDDRHFVMITDENGATTVRFGDGAHGARLPADADAIVSAYRTARRFVAVVEQGGRVIVDNDWNEFPAASDRLFGLYRGTVVDSDDPLGQARVLAQVAALGDPPLWAMPCRPVAAATLPAIGTAIWVAFEAGDRSRPVWMGLA